MRKVIALALFVPTIALAQSPFDGTWKIRLDSIQVSGKPDVIEISKGVYDCSSCVPPYKIKADGTDQPVPGHAYVDHEAVKVTSASSIEITDKLAGKLMFSMTQTVSDDGAKLTSRFTGYTGEHPVNGEYTEKRVGPRAPGAHAISGSWMQDSMLDLSEAGLVIVLQSTPNGLKMVSNGQTTDAKFDGKEYLTADDPGKTTVTLKKISATQIEET
ncbi:MAG: hypothetical protein ACLPV8_20285, partial [Steroidobacteraceae bacterium]